jgi:hypothetical protein
MKCGLWLKDQSKMLSVPSGCNKQDEYGFITRNKARLVAKGYLQVEGLSQFVYYLPMLLTMVLSFIKWTLRVTS